MLVGHLAEYSDYARNVDAVIGMDLLKRCNFSIDYDSRKIIFHTRQGEYTQVAREPLSECVILQLQVQGQFLRLIVDTGFPGILLFEDRLHTHLPGLQIAGKISNVTLGGRLSAKQAILPGLTIGARSRAASVLLVQGPPSNALPGIDGFVGIACLRARLVNFDTVDRILSWE